MVLLFLMTLNSLTRIMTRRNISAICYICFFFAGTTSGYYGFQLGQSVLASLNTPHHEKSEIPSHAISNAYLIESVIEELPHIDLDISSRANKHESTFFAAHPDIDSREDTATGMGGAIDLGRALLSSRISNSKSTFSLMNKIKPHNSLPGKMQSRDYKYIDIMQKRISRIPIGSPVVGKITSQYGRRVSPFKAGRRDIHTGIDIAVDEGTPIHASADGEIVFAERKGAYGKAILLRHPSGYETLYAHLSDILVEEGQTVCRGQQIGFVGTTGRSTGPHLHYEVRENGSPIDPAPFIELAHVLRFAK
jgi:murein DD-endopeptidase MepM/ murein hydrolase activator NlpD